MAVAIIKPDDSEIWHGLQNDVTSGLGMQFLLTSYWQFNDAPLTGEYNILNCRRSRFWQHKNMRTISELQILHCAWRKHHWNTEGKTDVRRKYSNASGEKIPFARVGEGVLTAFAYGNVHAIFWVWNLACQPYFWVQNFTHELPCFGVKVHMHRNFW